MNDSPNGLKTATPIVARMSSLPLYAIIGAGMILLAVLIYSVNFAHDPQKEVKESKKVTVSDQENTLLLLPHDRKKTDAVVSGVKDEITEAETGKADNPNNTAKDAEQALSLNIIQDSTIADEELERIKRQKQQAYFAALSAPMVAKRVTPTASSARSQATQASNANYDATQDNNNISSELGAENRYDPASDRDKESFFSRSKSADSSWMLGNARTIGQEFEIKTGTVIPSVMLSSINAELPGALIAQVSQNVYNSSGDNLLIPRGSRLYGAYDSRIVYGQSRVLVAWNRLMFPDGSAITLGAMPGSDMSGNAGFEDKTNNHYFRIFGSAVLMSLVTGGMAYGMDSMNTSGDNETSMQNEMATALAAQLGQTTTTLLQKNLNIKPTLEIRTGYQFNIVVTKDIVFEKPYKAWR